MADIVDLATEKLMKKSAESNLSRDWLPRDALVEVLQMSDAGEINPKSLTIGWVEHFKPDECVTVDHRLAAPNAADAAYLTAALHWRLTHGIFHDGS